MSIIIRPFEIADRRLILELFARTFGKPVSADWWNWRFLDNPVDSPRIRLAFDGEKLVSHYAVSPFLLNNRGIVRPAALSMTTMTDADYRSYGLFPKTAEALYEELASHGFAGVYGFPNNQSHVPFLHKLAWRNIHAQHTLRLDHAKMRRKPTTRRISVEIKEIAAVSFEHLPHSEWANCSNHPELSPEWLRWRLSPRSGNTYRIAIVADDAASPLGWVAFKQFSAEAIDLVLINTATSEDLAAVLDTLAETYDDIDISFNAWAALDDARHLQLEALGALAGGPVTYFSGRDFNRKPNRVSNENWQFPMIFSDVY